MKFRSGAFAPALVLCLAAQGGFIPVSAVADGYSAPGSNEQSGHSEEAGETGTEQSAMTPEKGASPGGMGEQEIKADAARMSLAPHTIAVETSLLSALDQIRGLKAQVRTAQNQPTSEFMAQYKVHTREIQDALKSARTHEGQLKERAQKFPSVAQSEPYRQVAPAISDVERLSQQWEKQTASTGYWQNNVKVSSDLDQLEKRLTNALEKTRGFSSHIDVSQVG